MIMKQQRTFFCLAMLVLLIFLFSLSVQADCSSFSLNVSKQLVLANDFDVQEAALTINCNSTNELNAINDTRLQINRISSITQPFYVYFMWSEKGFQELGRTTNAYVKLLVNQSERITDQIQNRTILTFR